MKRLLLWISIIAVGIAVLYPVIFFAIKEHEAIMVWMEFLKFPFIVFAVGFFIICWALHAEVEKLILWILKEKRKSFFKSRTKEDDFLVVGLFIGGISAALVGFGLSYVAAIFIVMLDKPF